MAALKITNSSQINATLVSNNFIDDYMINSNGEFVKVYLFLLRHMNDPCSSITIPMIADCLHHTENDICRALHYWEGESLISLEESEGQITGICFNSSCGCFAGSLADAPASNQFSALEKSASSPVTTVSSGSTALENAKRLDAAKSRQELKSLFYVAEQYLGKTLSHDEMNLICSFQDELGFSTSLIEYLIETCVEHGHTSFRYIQKVALNWADQKIQTVSQAQAHESAFDKDYYSVLKAFGIRDRAPVSGEKLLMDKWIDEWAFSMDIILEACNRTMTSLHRPSFEYADSILSNWHKENVHHLKDIDELDEAFKQERKSKSVKPRPVTKNMNNFERRNYDMDSLESKLLN